MSEQPSYQIYSSHHEAMHYERLAEIFKAIAHPVRLEIIDLIAKYELSVGTLEHSLDLPQPIISRHLSYLRRAHIVTVRRAGTSSFYRLTDPAITNVLNRVY